MALISQESLLGMLVPDVYIDGITLESSGTPALVDNPHIDDVRESQSRRAINAASKNRTLRVTVDLSIKERLDNSMIGTWFREQDFHKYLKIQVFQTTNPDLIKIFSYSQNMINLATTGISEGYWTASELDMIAQPFGSLEKALQALHNKNIFDRRVLSVSADVIGDNSDMTQISSTVDENGVSIHDFTYRVVYELDVLEPKNLAVFAVSYLDLGAMKSDYELEFNVGTLESQNGKVVAENIIKKGKVSSTSTVYTLPDGEYWTGPIHKISNNRYSTGSAPSSESIVLRKKSVPNDKIQDFREVDEIMRYSLDISDSYKAISALNRAKLLTNNKTFVENKDSYFSNLWLSRDTTGSSRFMFAFDMKEFLKKNSIYGNLLKRNHPLVRENILNSTSIRSIKLMRRRVKNVTTLNKLGSVSTGQILFDKKEPHVSVIMTGADATGKLKEKKTQLYSIREANPVISEVRNEKGIRYFTAQDSSMRFVTDGLYQYGVEIDIEDGIIEFLRKVTADLTKMRRDLDLYLEYSLKPGMTKFLQEISDPHIDDSSERASLVYKSTGHYDSLKNRFTDNFYTFMQDQFTTPSAPFFNKLPWLDASLLYVNSLNIISQEAENAMTKQKVNIAEKINVFMSPTSGTPQGIMAVMNLFDHLISKYRSLTGDDYRDRKRATVGGTSSTPQASVSSGENQPGVLLKCNYWFDDNFFDSNVKKSSGFDYLTDMNKRRQSSKKNLGKISSYSTAMAMSEYQNVVFGSRQKRGLKIVDGGYWTKRVNSEVLKYFTEATANINVSFGTEDYTKGDSLDNTSFGYLSPSYVAANNKVYTLTLEQDADYYVKIEGELLADKANILPQPQPDTSQYQHGLQSIFSDLNVTVTTPMTKEPVPQTLTQQAAEVLLDDCADQQLQAVDPYPAWRLDEDGNVVAVPTEVENDEVPIGEKSSNYVDFFKKISDIVVSGLPQPGNMPVTKFVVPTQVMDVTNSENVIVKMKEDAQFAASVLVSNGQASKDPTPSNAVSSLPNQIKSVIIMPINPSILKDSVSATADDWLYSSKFNLNYQFLVSVERFDGFEYVFVSEDEPSELSVRHERWQRMTKEFYQASKGKEILCRLTPYACEKLGIVPQQGIDAPVYDEYFLIVPPVKTEIVQQTNDPLAAFRKKMTNQWKTTQPGIRQIATNTLIIGAS